MKKIYLVPFHSVADVITNSSSELFMIASAMSEDAVKQIVANMIEETPEDVDVKIISTFDGFIDFVEEHGLNFYSTVDEMLNVGCPPEPGEDWFELGFELEAVEYGVHDDFNKRMRMDSAVSERNERNMRSLLRQRRGELEPLFKPIMLVKAWCEEGTDKDVIAKAFKGVVCGGF